MLKVRSAVRTETVVRQASNTALIFEIVGSECSRAQQIAADTDALGDNLVSARLPRVSKRHPAAGMAPTSECPQNDSNAICGFCGLLALVRACPGVATPRKWPDTRLTYQSAECRAGRYAQDQQHGAGLRGTLWKMTVLLTVLFIRKNKKPNIHGALKPSFDSCRTPNAAQFQERAAFLFLL